MADCRRLFAPFLARISWQAWTWMLSMASHSLLDGSRTGDRRECPPWDPRSGRCELTASRARVNSRHFDVGGKPSPRSSLNARASSARASRRKTAACLQTSADQSRLMGMLVFAARVWTCVGLVFSCALKRGGPGGVRCVRLGIYYDLNLRDRPMKRLHAT